MIYLDSTALVRLVVREPETPELIRFLHDRRSATRVCSSTAGQETLAAVAGCGHQATARARQVLASPTLVEIDPAGPIDDYAAAIAEQGLGRARATHLATVLFLASAVTDLVTYDEPLRVAAAARGIHTVTPR